MTKKREVISVPAEALLHPDIPGWFRQYALQHARHLERLLDRMQQRIEAAAGIRDMPIFEQDIQMQGKRIRNGGDPVDLQDFVTRAYLERSALVKRDGQYELDAPLNGHGHRLRNVGQARATQDAENRGGAQADTGNALEAFLTNPHTWTAPQTFTAGIALGNETLSVYDEGSFTATGTGFTTSVTGTAAFVQVGKQVALFLPSLTGTSNATTFTVTGMPAGIQPTQTSWHMVRVMNNSVDVVGLLRLNGGSSTIDVFATIGAGAFAAALTKTLYPTWISYALM